MSRNSQRKAGAPKGLGRADSANHLADHHLKPSRCVCGVHATGRVEAVMLSESVVMMIGTCDRHAPTNDGEAMNLVRALLHGIANAGRDIDIKARSGGGDGHA